MIKAAPLCRQPSRTYCGKSVLKFGVCLIHTDLSIQHATALHESPNNPPQHQNTAGLCEPHIAAGQSTDSSCDHQNASGWTLQPPSENKRIGSRPAKQVSKYGFAHRWLISRSAAEWEMRKWPCSSLGSGSL